jgi:hypothetical protein
VQYFHVVLTVSAPIAAIALQNKAFVYDILLSTAAETRLSRKKCCGQIRPLAATIGVPA